MSDGSIIGITVIAVLVVLALLAFVIAATCERLSFPGEVARIERLRKDVRAARPGSDEDVIGLAAEMNQRIASRKQYNSLWWADLVLPDGWDDIQFIAIPAR